MPHIIKDHICTAAIPRIAALMAMLIISSLMIMRAQSPALQVIAKSDSTTLVMGDRVAVTVEVLKNAHGGSLLNMPEKEKDYHGMEMVDCSTDSADLGNSRIQLVYHFTFQAFDPKELLTLPPFQYASQGDTARSDILTFKVLPVDLSPELGNVEDIQSLKVHPDEPVVSIPGRWYDVIPDWWIWVVIGIAVIALIVVLLLLYKKNGPKIFVARKPTPPYELAIGKLNHLRDKRLAEKGLGKEFYTELTDIWREYLQGRFGINAMEMTSKQILKQLRDNPETHLTVAQLEQVLEISDFVKFAALTPTREEMDRAYNLIYAFVESTRPAPEDDENTKDKPKTDNE